MRYTSVSDTVYNIILLKVWFDIKRKKKKKRIINDDRDDL